MNGRATARGIAAARLLDLWEAGMAARPSERALLLLRLAEPELDDDALVELTVGQQDRALLRLRERWFGPAIVAGERCPWCGERMELTFDVADVLVDASAPAENRHVAAIDGYEIVFRLPTIRQVAGAALGPDVATARAALLAWCLLEIRHDGAPVAARDLPPPVIDQIERAMEASDPQANVELALRCVACERVWSVSFDIVSFLWEEIVAWARRVIREVHQLAAAYGWSEREILAMGPARRARYLEMATGG